MSRGGSRKTPHSSTLWSRLTNQTSITSYKSWVIVDCIAGASSWSCNAEMRTNLWVRSFFLWPLTKIGDSTLADNKNHLTKKNCFPLFSYSVWNKRNDMHYNVLARRVIGQGYQRTYLLAVTISISNLEFWKTRQMSTGHISRKLRWTWRD